MARFYIPKELKLLKNQELEDCPQNDLLFDKLLDHIKVSKLLKKELSKNLPSKDLISVSNTLNGNSKSIIAIMNAFIYKDEEEVNEIDDLFKGYNGGN